MKVTDEWQRVLKSKGYTNLHCTTKVDYLKIKLLPRVWRRILKFTGLAPGKALEVGCGGGKQLVPLAVKGWDCYGLDCSPEILERAKRYIHEVEKFHGEKLNIKLYHGDFLNLPENHPLFLLKYDLVFNVGVIEHYLDPEERRRFLAAKFRLTKPGGYVVSVVPSGQHPCREKAGREVERRGEVPYINYTIELCLKEMKECGASEVSVLPHDIFGYCSLIDDSRMPKWAIRLGYYLAQMVPMGIVPRRLAEVHANTFIAIGRK